MPWACGIIFIFIFLQYICNWDCSCYIAVVFGKPQHTEKVSDTEKYETSCNVMMTDKIPHRFVGLYLAFVMNQ